MLRPRPGSDGQKPRISIISYKGLSRLVHAVIPDYRGHADIDVVDVVFNDALAAAQQIERDGLADVIVSAGANADILGSALKLPVVTIKASGYDIMMALFKARHYSERVGVITYRETMQELDEIKDLLRIEVSQRAYHSPEDAEDTFRSLAAEGFRVIVGSSLVCDLAQRHGITGILIYRHDSVRLALDNAIQIARVANMEAARFEQLNSVMRHLHEAVLSVDTLGRITAINPLMEHALSAATAQALGRRLSEISPTIDLTAVLESGEDVLDTVVQINRTTYVANQIAIRDQGRLAGAILTLQDANMIHRADSNIRTQRRERSLIARYRFAQIVGSSEALVLARTSAERYAKTNSTVLITGESGTGKELFAQAIHNASNRSAGPFVAVNCAAFPEQLLESELFGYEEGAFTGSRRGGKAGLFEFAHTGTIFLDEIGDMPMTLQTRLLRVLQEKEIVRLGGARPVPVDVRIIAATNHSLAQLVDRGRLRDDLYYRLNILHLRLPPLRERVEDVPLLALQLLHRAMRRLGSSLPADQALAPLMPLLRGYRWPGNVRELENVTERLAVVLGGYAAVSQIDYNELQADFPELFPQDIGTKLDPTPRDKAAKQALDQDAICRVLAETGGNRRLAADRLGLSRTTLWRRLRSQPID